MLANEGSESGTGDLSSAFKLIPLCLGSTFLVFILFTPMERSVVLHIYFHFPLEKCERLPCRLNVEIITIVIVTKIAGGYNVLEKKIPEGVASGVVAFPP